MDMDALGGCPMKRILVFQNTEKILDNGEMPICRLTKVIDVLQRYCSAQTL